jgi:hypothetical protein
MMIVNLVKTIIITTATMTVNLPLAQTSQFQSTASPLSILASSYWFIRWSGPTDNQHFLAVAFIFVVKVALLRIVTTANARATDSLPFSTAV